MANNFSQYAPRRTIEIATPGGGAGKSVDAKVVVMGNAGVGKTSLVNRYTQGTFYPASTTSTTGATFQAKKTTVDGVNVRLQLWDTAGQERFRSMAPMYYRGAHAALLVYDITDLDSFKDLKSWLEELRKNTSTDTTDMIIYIVGSKADLVDQRAVTQDRARALLRQWFPPPQAPPPTPSSLMAYNRPGYPFNGGSSLYPNLPTAAGLTHSISTTISNSISIPQQLTTLSTQFPTLPSFNIPRPRFPSLPSSKVLNATIPVLPPSLEEECPPSAVNSTPGTSATSNNTTLTSTTGETSTYSASSVVYDASASQPDLLHSPPAPKPKRLMSPPPMSFAPPYLSDQGLNVNMRGSGYSGFSGAKPYTSASPSVMTEASQNVSYVKGRVARRHTSIPGPSKPPPNLNMTRTSSTRSVAGPSGPGSQIRPRRGYGDDLDLDPDDASGRRRASSRPAFRNCPDPSTPSDDSPTGYFSDDNQHVNRPFEARSQPFPPIVTRSSAKGESESEPDVEDEEELVWGFSKDLRMFEVSSKDGNGIHDLFTVLLQAIIKRRETIEAEQLMRERDSVVLDPNPPSWGAIAAANEGAKNSDNRGRKAGYNMWGWGGNSCCGT